LSHALSPAKKLGKEISERKGEGGENIEEWKNRTNAGFPLARSRERLQLKGEKIKSSVLLIHKKKKQRKKKKKTPPTEYSGSLK